MPVATPEGDPAPAHFDRALKRQTNRSIGWTMLRAGGDQIASFLVFLLMARLLTKVELGIFALAYVFAEIGRAIASAGLTQLVARAKSLNKLQIDTLFWTSILLAAAYCGLVVAVAPVAARAFDAPELAGVLRWMSLPVMLNAVGNTHMALRLREFGHSTLAARSLVAGLIGGIAAVAAALLGAGVWSLVVQRSVREAVGSVLAWGAHAWRPRLRLDAAQAKENLRFGSDLAAAQLVALLTLRAQDLMIGRMIGAAAVSTYRVAWRCTELFGSAAVAPFSTVALQTFSRLQDNPAALRTAYMTLIRRCGLLAIPALVGYGLAGPWLVPSLFGPQWDDAGRIAPALMLLALPFTLNGFVIALLSALGRAAWQRQLAVLDLASTVAVTALAVRHGLVWVALGYSLRANLLLPVQLHLVRKASGIGVRDHLSALWPALLATLAMGALVTPLLYTLDTRNLLVLGPVCALGAVIYGLVALLCLPGERRDLLNLLRRRATAQE